MALCSSAEEVMGVIPTAWSVSDVLESFHMHCQVYMTYVLYVCEYMFGNHIIVVKPLYNELPQDC